MEDYVAKATGSLLNSVRVKNNEYNGFYRGTVVNNEDTESRGRCKIFIRGVYNEEFVENDGALLPWAEPCQPLFCGGMGEDGENGTFQCPDMNSTVWCFFENGDVNKPVFFGQTTDANGRFSTKHCTMKWEKMRWDLYREDTTNTITTSAYTDITEIAGVNINRDAQHNINDVATLTISLSSKDIKLTAGQRIDITAPVITLNGNVQISDECHITGLTTIEDGDVKVDAPRRVEITTPMMRVDGDFATTCGVNGIIDSRTKAVVKKGVVVGIVDGGASIKRT